MKKTILILFLVPFLLVGCTSGSSPVDSVNDYILNSRKSAYIDTLLGYIDGVMRDVNTAKTLKFYDTDVLYLVPVGFDKNYSCKILESGGKSPFSDEWNFLYVGVTYDGKGYNYYAVGEDKSVYGIEFLNRKTIVDYGVNYLYTKSKEDDAGYKILKERYSKASSNKVYELDSSDFKELSNILKTTNNENYTEIVMIGSKDCSYSSI